MSGQNADRNHRHCRESGGYLLCRDSWAVRSGFCCVWVVNSMSHAPRLTTFVECVRCLRLRKRHTYSRNTMCVLEATRLPALYERLETKCSLGLRIWPNLSCRSAAAAEDRDLPHVLPRLAASPMHRREEMYVSVPSKYPLSTAALAKFGQPDRFAVAVSWGTIDGFG